MSGNLGLSIAPIQPVVLLGYMGCGKSTVGRLLAKHLNIPFIDLDEYLSSLYGLSIPDLFLKHGEIGFRKLEQKALHELLSTTQTSVLSLGGGTPCYADNMRVCCSVDTPHLLSLSNDFHALSALVPRTKSSPFDFSLEFRI